VTSAIECDIFRIIIRDAQHNEPAQVTRELRGLSAETSSARAHSIVIAYHRHLRIQNLPRGSHIGC
jgi:hypothetical protein